MLIRVILLTLLPIFSMAQTRQEFWSKLTISKKIDEKWNWGGDIQYRSQENHHLQNNQRFANDLLQSIRLTAFYKISEKHKLSLIASPIVYFRSFDINNEGNSIDQREYRWVIGVMQQYTISKKIHLRNRLQYEMRFLRIDSPNITLQHRPRWQLQATVPLWKVNQNFGINYLVFDEIFVANQENRTFFEQNRFYNALQFRYNFVELNVGLQKSVQKVREDWIRRNQWHISANFIL